MDLWISRSLFLRVILFYCRNWLFFRIPILRVLRFWDLNFFNKSHRTKNFQNLENWIYSCLKSDSSLLLRDESHWNSWLQAGRDLFDCTSLWILADSRFRIMLSDPLRRPQYRGGLSLSFHCAKILIWTKKTGFLREKKNNRRSIRGKAVISRLRRWTPRAVELCYLGIATSEYLSRRLSLSSQGDRVLIPSFQKLRVVLCFESQSAITRLKPSASSPALFCFRNRAIYEWWLHAQWSRNCLIMASDSGKGSIPQKSKQNSARISRFSGRRCFPLEPTVILRFWQTIGEKFSVYKRRPVSRSAISKTISLSPSVRVLVLPV